MNKDYFELSKKEFLMPFDVPPIKYGGAGIFKKIL